MRDPHLLGRLGEALAARILEERGWRVLARNYRFGHREVDLVVRRGPLVAFVEVKTRAGAGFGHPLEAITALKRREIERVAVSWVLRHGRPRDEYRFDAVAILWDGRGEPEVAHVEGAWTMGE